MRIDRAAEQQLATMPPQSGRRFLVFVDTEEEFDWAAPFRREATTAAIAALPDQHERFVAAGIQPTYLVTCPIADDPVAATMLRGFVARGQAEIGAQLHPWVTPPFDEELSLPNSFAGNLPEAVERAKLIFLTDRITTTIGRRPVIYRAGRYGVGPATARLLRETGYTLDVSIRPGFDYRREGGPDFTGFGSGPFILTRSLFALPLGVGFTGLFGGSTEAVLRWARHSSFVTGLLARLHLAARVPLTPEGVSAAEAKAAIDAMLARGTRLFSLSFHSPSLVPGCTPYVRTATDLASFKHWWNDVLDHLAARDVRPWSADDLIDALKEGQGE